MSRASWTTDAWREAEETLSAHVGVYHAQSRIERDLLSDVVCSDLAPCGEEVGECQCCEIFPRPVVIAFDDPEGDSRVAYWAPAASAAEALFGSDAREHGTPDMLHAELVTELDGAFLSARLWGLACRAYAQCIANYWASLGRMDWAEERSQELDEIAAWEMSAAADEAIAAE